MALFLGLFLGHLLGDFALQPGRLVVAKRRGPAGMLLHTAIVVACTVAVNLGDLVPRLWPITLAGIAHLAIEYLTVRARRVADATGLVVFLLDQALHVTSLALIAGVVGDGRPAVVGPWQVTPAALGIVCGTVVVAFMGAILTFEVHVARLGADAPAQPILGFDSPRLYGMLERSAALGIALALGTPYAAAGILAFAPKVAFALTRPAKDRDRLLSDALVGLLLCAVAWALLLAFFGSID